jgi:porphobilinogen synthase
MPGQFQFSVDQLLVEVDEAQSLGVPAVLLFGVPSSKDGLGTEAYDDDGIIQRATRAIKQTMPDMVVITDVCLCEYTDHGHCGILTNEGLVDNDSTLELLAKTAVSQARAGADIVAPSAMMDGQVTALRAGLEAAGMAHVPVMAYASKFSSAYYGPFRIAAESTPKSGDRKSYQMDGANFREALREMEQDALEGADILMVKPALAYLDILSKARQRFDHPMAAYNVSGEYSMLKAAAAAGWLDETAAMMEMLISIKRAGADFIMTYFAKDAARVLRESA